MKLKTSILAGLLLGALAAGGTLGVRAAEPDKPQSAPAAAGEQPAATKFAANPGFKALPGGELKALVPAHGHKADVDVLKFSGMVYDHHRHKVLAFGGGHATARFPNSVHEFDPATLKWTALTEDVPPAEYNAANAVKTAGGQNLGGVKSKGKVWAGSRHTYDGLVMLPDKGLMVSMQAQEFVGASYSMPGGEATYDANYKGGTGLWIFDPVKREWTVSDKTGLATAYCYAEASPKRPELIYFGSAGRDDFFALNIKTLEVKKLASHMNVDTGGDMSMTWYPEKDTFLAFPTNPNGKTGCRVLEYDPARNIWAELKPAGDAPSTYSINVAYDALNKVFVCFGDNRCFYLSPVENKWYKLDKQLPIANRLFHHHVYDPVDNVHILVGDKWDTYAYKLSDEPGKLPGTGQPKN
jgi:hypothetical protein